MVKFSGLDKTFAALSDPTRLALVDRLTRGEATVSELAEPFDMSLPAILKHIRVLESAGLMRCEKSGRARVCRLDPAGLERAVSWLERRRLGWERRAMALEKHLGGGAS